MSLINYALKRILSTIPILFGVLFITFALARQMPGSPFLLEGQKLQPELAAMREEQLGLNEPIYIQFWLYLKNIANGDWGNSIVLSQGQNVWEFIWLKAPVTFELAILSTFFASLIGVRAGVFSAVNKNNIKDTIVRFTALLGVAVPVFWLGMLLKFVFSIRLDLFPTLGYMTNALNQYLPKITGFGMLDSIITGNWFIFFDILWHMALPLFCLTFITLAGITRQTRSSMLEVLELDYIRSARAKGCKEKDVINTHALRNALIPTVTIIGMGFGGILGGAVLTETTFNLHGFGMLMVDAIQTSDYFVINALVFLTTTFFITANLVTDLMYAILDPRIRY